MVNGTRTETYREQNFYEKIQKFFEKNEPLT